MKVCFVSGEYPPMQGGVADYTQRLAWALEGFGVDSYVITSTKARSGATQPPLFAAIEEWGFSSWSKIVGIIHQISTDLVHIQYQTAAYGMQPAITLLPFWLHRRIPGIPIITTFHDLRVPYLFPKAGKLRQWTTRVLVNGSDGIVVTNEEDLMAVKRAGYRIAKLHLIPIGSNIIPALPDDYDRGSWRARYDIDAGDILLSYFGLLNSSKGVETLLAALGGLLESIPRTKLLMVGASIGASDLTNVAYEQRILELIEDRDLQDVVRFTGYLPPSEVSASLAASDICVLPFRDGASFRRGSLMAALAHGLPIVTTDFPDGSGTRTEDAFSRLPRLVHRESCLLVAPADEKALVGAIMELADSPQLRKKLSEGALGLARSFAWERIARETVEMYHSILGRRTPC